MKKEFLDNQQYSELAILHYEKIYGRNYISPGGEIITDQFIRTLELRSQMNVLDIGSGLGGPAFRMAGKSGVFVHGIDLSENMVRIAKKRLKEEGLNNLVKFEQGNCLDFQTESTYNVVHSRDVFLHIKNKLLLFEVIHKALVSVGHLAFSDYCLGITKTSPEFGNYINKRKYSLHTFENYTNLLELSGFTNIYVEDRTDLFLKTLKQELNNLKSAALKKREKTSLRQLWQHKIKRAERGELGWGWFYCVKGGQ